MFIEKGEKTMKKTGMVRKIDDLGRIVIPIEIRNTLGIENRDSLEIFVEDDLPNTLPPAFFAATRRMRSISVEN